MAHTAQVGIWLRESKLKAIKEGDYSGKVVHPALIHLAQLIGGVFWLIIPLRPTGRHEGMSNTVDAVFPLASEVGCGGEKELAVLTVEEIRKQDGVVRADEGGYKLYKIGWI